MSKFNVYIIDPFYKVPTVAVCDILDQWFAPIVEKAGYDDPFVCCPQYNVITGPQDLMVYVCPFPTSVVQRMPGVPKPDVATAVAMGLTRVATPTGSEIWVKTSDVNGLASLIFHEAMHNKLQLGDELHHRFRPGVLSVASINWSTRPTPSAPEIKAMAAALKNPVPQWTDGQAILWNAARKKEGGDPTWDLDITT